MNNINAFALSGILIAVSSFSFGIFVLVKGYSNRSNIVWSIFSFSVGIWGAGAYFIGIAKSQEEALLMWKLAHIGIIFIPVFFLHYVDLFLKKYNYTKIVTVYLLGFLFLFLDLFTDFFIKNVRFVFNSFYYDSPPTPIYVVFVILWLIGIIYPHCVLLKALYKEEGIRKQRIKLFFIATIIGFLGGLTSFLPVFGIDIYPYLNFTVPLYPAIMSYAITRYQLLNIRYFTAQIIIAIMNVIAFSYIFASETYHEYIIKSAFFVAIAFTSLLLKRSFDQEIKQKERLKQLAKELEKTNIKLVELDKAKNEFISIAAHQLRTPPTVIKGYVAMALEEINNVKGCKNVEEYLMRAQDSNERLIELVEDILDISRIESGKIQYHFEDNQDCEKILDGLYEAFEVRAKKKGLKMILKKTSKNLPKIRMDSKRIREVISNLIDNAIKYTQRGQVVVEQKLVDNGKKIRIEVSDTGVGIAPEDMPNLFKKFSRGTDTGRLGADGTGLGIYVGKKIIKAHHGEIWAESEGVNKGSKFIIELPVVWKEEWLNENN